MQYMHIIQIFTLCYKFIGFGHDYSFFLKFIKLSIIHYFLGVNQRSLRSLIIASIFSSSSGPIARHVVVGLSKTVKHASVINAVTRLMLSAFFLKSSNSFLSLTFSTIFFMPSSCQISTIDLSD